MRYDDIDGIRMVWNAVAVAAAVVEEDTDTWLGPTIDCMEIITMVSSIGGLGGCNNNDAILVPDGEMAMMTIVSAVVKDGNSFVFILFGRQWLSVNGELVSIDIYIYIYNILYIYFVNRMGVVVGLLTSLSIDWRGPDQRISRHNDVMFKLKT